MCTYVMDDNNVYRDGIRDELMREVLAKSDLRLAISPELRDAYEKKYALKFWMLPPVVTPQALQTIPVEPVGPQFEQQVGVLVGSLWSVRWLQRLRETMRASGLRVHWFGNARAPWLKVTPDELRADGILNCGFLAEAELTRRLRNYPYALVPSGALDEQDDRPEIARLSLPTRLPYLLAAANLPTLVLGHPQTAAAHFLERFRFGAVVPYDGRRLAEAVADITKPDRQRELRQHAAGQSRLFSADGLAEWLWRSLENGQPPDERFERAFRRSDTEIVPYLDPPAPKDLGHDLALVYHALARLKRQGFAPDFVLDVGSSTGVWSDAVKRVFPTSRFVLVDPLHHQYAKLNDWYFRKNPDFEPVAAAVSDRPGEAELSVSEDLYGSSLLQPADCRAYSALRVPVRTLDDVMREKGLAGRGLLKIDVQFAEHLVLAGARKLLSRVDALLVELSLLRYAPQAMVFEEMWELIRRLGFRYYEDIGGWRSPSDGTTLQKDVLFLRQHLFQYRPRAQSKTAEANGNGTCSAPPHQPAAGVPALAAVN
jgi:FkbM family methyltransferase